MSERRRRWFDRTTEADGTFTDPPTVPPARAPILSADHEQAEGLATFTGFDESTARRWLRDGSAPTSILLDLAAQLAEREREIERLRQTLETIADERPALEVGPLGKAYIEKQRGYAQLALDNHAQRSEAYAEHLAEARAVEEHQERKHGD